MNNRARNYLIAFIAVAILCAGIVLAMQGKANAADPPPAPTSDHCSLTWTDPHSERANECRARGWTIKSRMVLDPTNRVRVLVGLRPCRYEDSNNCYWRARCHGNKQGDSFVNLNGRIWFASFGNYQCRHA